MHTSDTMTMVPEKNVQGRPENKEKTHFGCGTIAS